MEARDYLSVALQRLDLLLHREILRLRASYQLSLDEFRGLYISDEQVNQLVNRSVNYEGPSSAIDELTQKAEALRAADSDDIAGSPWYKLIREFSLSLIEQDILLLAVAPEIDLKYETLFAYLNNDITRKWPTFNLALQIGAALAEQRSDVRRCLLPEATLFSSGLLQLSTSGTDRRSWLATGFSAAPSVYQYLTNTSSLDPRLALFVEQRTPSINWERLPISSDLRKTLRRFSHRYIDSRSRLPTIILVGHEGVGRALAAEAVCHELGFSSLLRVDLDVLRSSGENIGQLTRALLLQQRLHAAGLYLSSFEALFDKEQKPLPESRGLFKILSQAKGPVFIPSESGTPWRELLAEQRAICFRFDLPDYATRLRLWKDAITTVDADVASSELEALADRFALTPGQISSAVAGAADAQSFSDLDANAVDAAKLFDAARAQSDQSPGRLAAKVKTLHNWDDLILPRLTLQRVKEITAAIRYRHVVYSEWGFEKRIAAGLGLKVLFSGPSGTCKTMTAGVIARDLGLDLYKIDLSGIVSKYIGETEKNLDRIFRAAQSSNAILFFDEADALFGKRSEVKDAHDRYANIEVAYLLQKIEEYEGVVILASNLSRNIDEAFSRRMHYVVEFPLPDETHRERLWRGMFPAEVPMSGDVDFQFLAKQFPIAGGDIRNVALDAAFLAAQDGKLVTMKQLAKALARQMMKQGKIPSATDFKQYHGLIVDGV
jgi:DNA polymerase III delta prime subunit